MLKSFETKHGTVPVRLIHRKKSHVIYIMCVVFVFVLLFVIVGEGSAPPPALPEDSPFYGLTNVILTPHIGWQRMESRQRVVDTCAENIVTFARGDPTNIDMETGRPRR